MSLALADSTGERVYVGLYRSYIWGYNGKENGSLGPFKGIYKGFYRGYIGG